MRIRRQAGSEDLVPRPVGVDGADIVIITIRAQDDGAHPSRENDLGAVWRPAGVLVEKPVIGQLRDAAAVRGISSHCSPVGGKPSAK